MAQEKKQAPKKGAAESAEVNAPETTSETPQAKSTASANSDKKTAPVVEVKKGPTVAKRSARKEEQEEVDPEVKIESALGRFETFLIENGKSMLTVIIIAVVVVAGFLAYKYLYLGNRAEKAGAAMFVAEQQFGLDSFALALNGDGNNAGFLDVIDNYGSTPQGNIARHYAGVCYLKLGDLDNALNYLSQYKTTKGAPNVVINAMNLGLQGDIYVQKGQYDQAVDQFRKAIEASTDPLAVPMYLKKLGLVYNKQGKNNEALAAFQRISDEFPASLEARDIEKFIGAQEQK